MFPNTLIVRASTVSANQRAEFKTSTIWLDGMHLQQDVIRKNSTNMQDNETDLRNIHEETLEQLPDVLLCERLLVVHLRVNVAVV